MKNDVFPRNPPTRPATGVNASEFVSEPIKTFARRLRGTAGKDIWMTRGGEVIASFLHAGEIDEFDTLKTGTGRSTRDR